MKIVFLDHKSLNTVKPFDKFYRLGEFTTYETTAEDQVVMRCLDCDVVITNKVKLDKEVLEHLPKLKLICVAATGTNNIDLEYAKERGIEVKNVAGYSTKSVVQQTFAMLLSLTNKLSFYDNYVKSGEYSKSDFFMNASEGVFELNKKVFGIIGLGEIGRKVARTARAFGARVVYYSTTGNNFSHKYQKLELNELLSIADVVSIHAPLNENTMNLIDKDRVKLMKQNAILLNTGRGGIVCEESLARAIDMEMIAGAAVDVFTHEPILDDNPLLTIAKKEKILFTPHNAWASVESRSRLVKKIINNIKTHFKEENTPIVEV